MTPRVPAQERDFTTNAAGGAFYAVTVTTTGTKKKKAAHEDLNFNSTACNRHSPGQRRSKPVVYRSIESYIPPYLSNLIRPYHGDFCYTPVFHPRLITQLMAEGFLPIATEGYLLPKLHCERSVIRLPHELHLSKSVRKKAKRFVVTVNQAWDGVVAGCRQQHDGHCWLYPPLVRAFREIQTNKHNTAVVAVKGNNNNNNTNKSSTKRSSDDSTEPACVSCAVQLYSVEVWNAATGALAAGELGYTVNSIYTSLTGFSREDSAGSVQLATLGRWLCQNKFTWWDLGMDMEYKRSLGAQLIPRHDFVQLVHEAREQVGEWTLPVSSERINCKDIVDAVPTTV